MLRSSRLSATGVGMPDAANASSGFSSSGLAASARAAVSCASIGVVMANGDVEQGGGDHVAQRLVVRRLGIGDLFALLRDLRACGGAGALELRDAVVEGGEAGRGRRIARRGFRIVQCAGGLVGLRAQIGDVAAQGADGFFQRIEPRGDGRIGGGLARLRLRLRRHVRSAHRPWHPSLAARPAAPAPRASPAPSRPRSRPRLQPRRKMAR